MELTTPTGLTELAERTRAFVRDVCIPAEPRFRGPDVDAALRAELQAAARDARVFAPHVRNRWAGWGSTSRAGA